MKKKAIIVGVYGQDGSYLAELLIKKKYFVYGIVNKVKEKKILCLWNSKQSKRKKNYKC